MRSRWKVTKADPAQYTREATSMPIPSQTPYAEHTGNGVTTSFAYEFTVLSADDMRVKVDGVAVSTGFTVSGIGSRSGGAVVFSVAPASLATVYLYREVSLSRETDYQENGDLLAETLDDDFDRLWMAAQELQYAQSRGLRAQIGESLSELPSTESRALRVLGFDSFGNPVALTRTDDGGAALALDLLDSANQEKGVNLIAFKLNYMAGVSRLLGLKLSEWKSVTDFGVVMDSVDDQSTLMQAAIDAVCNDFTSAGSAKTLYMPEGSVVAGDLLLKRQGFRFFASGRYNSSIIAAPGADFVFGTNNQATTTSINEITLESFSIRFINNLTDAVGSAGIKLRYGFGHVLRDIHIMRSPGTGAHAAVGLLIQDGVYTTLVEKCSMDRERIESATSNRATTIVHIDGDAEQIELVNVASIRYFGTTVQGYESTSAPVGRFKATSSDSITFSSGYMETDRTNDDLFQLTTCTDVTIRDNDFRGFNQVQLNTYLALTNVDGLVSDGNSFLRGSSANWNYITRGGTNRRLRLMDRNAADASVDEIEFSGRLVIFQGNPLIDTATLSSVTTFGTQTRGYNAWSLIGANNSAVFINLGDQDDDEIGQIGYDHTTNLLSLKAGGGTCAQASSVALRPGGDNSITLGTGSHRWSVVYAASGTINTSDEATKQDIAPLSTAESLVAADIKGLIKKFRFKDSVTAKGDDARIHVGVIAQDVEAAFIARGLDPARYALFCRDEWDDQIERVFDEDGEPTDEFAVAIPAGSRLGIRYDELLAFVLSAV